jgi:hypothetical protein
MPERRTAAHANQSCNLSDIQSQIATEQEESHDPRTNVIAVVPLEKAKSCLEYSLLFVVQPF